MIIYLFPFRGNAVRVSPHVYNDETDFRRLVSGVARARKKKFF